MNLVKVGELMTKNVISIDPDLKVDVAVEVMRANNVRRLPVMTKANRLVGIISLSDGLIAAAEAKDELELDPTAMPRVRDAMTDYVYTVVPEQSVAEAAQLMINHKISALPVLDDQKNVVGIVTESDLFRYLAGHMDQAPS